MIFEPTELSGVVLVRPEPRRDERGFFARIWCREEFARAGIAIDLHQASISHNPRAGTLRGIHFAWPPAAEGKFVRCERGRVHDVAIDLRPGSPTFMRHLALSLDADDGTGVYLPPGLGHGFQTLVDDTRVLYLMSAPYRSELADGVRFDDAAFGIAWPLPVASIAERDRTYPDFDRTRHASRYRAAEAA